MKRCLVYLEPNCIQDGIALLEVARQYYENQGEELSSIETFGILINGEPIEGIGHFDNIFLINNSEIKDYDLMTITDLLSKVCESYNFDMILIPSSWQGRMLAPRLAIRLNTGLTADVTEIRHSDGITQLVRPAYSGRMLAGIVNCSNGPIMMSVRQNIFHYDNQSVKDTKLIKYEVDSLNECSIREVKKEKAEVVYDIRKSEVLVAGGGGVIKDFHELNELATLLNGHVAASRRVVDSGHAKRNIQVGQSGKTVSPKLYMALGIFGSIQHVEGLKNVKYMISVNTNAHSPICSLSDVVVVGDAATFTKMLIERIKRYKDEEYK